MRIAQVAPLTEAVPPKLYGGTERVVHWLTEELVALGNDVTLFASGDSQTSAKLDATWPKALRLDGSVRDPNALHMVMLERVCKNAMMKSSNFCISISTTIRSRCFRGNRPRSLPRCTAGSACPSISRSSPRSQPSRLFRFRTRSGARCRKPTGFAPSTTGCRKSY